MKRKFGWLIFVVVALVVPAVLFSTGHAERFTLNHEAQAKQAQLLSGASLKSGLVPSATSQQGEQEGARARLDQAIANEKANPTKEAKIEVDAALENYNRTVATQSGLLQDGVNALDSVPLPFTGTETENNGTPATANAIDVSGQRTAIISGSLSSAADNDFFTFTAAAGTKIWIYTDTGGTQGPGGVSRDTLIGLLAADGTTLIEAADDSGTGNGGDATVESTTASAIGGRTLTTGGTYFIRVTAFNNVVNPYRLFVVVTTAGAVAEVDPNGGVITANTIVAAGGATTGLRSGAINAGGDIDYFAVAADAGDTIYFNGDGDPERNGGWDMVLQLRDPNDNLILSADASSNTSDTAEASNYIVPTSGVYYVRVSHFNAAGTGTYNLMVAVAGGADLGITKVTSNPTPTNGGAAFSYTLTVTNFGPQAATDVVVTDPLPPGIIFQNVAVNTSPGSSVRCVGPPVATNGTVICESSNFLAGQVATITIVAQAQPDRASGVRTNTATITSGTPQPQPDVHPNSSSVQQNLLVDAPLSITKAGPADICAGDTYTYHVTVLNGGSSHALNATVSDPLPANTTFLSVVGTGAFANTCSHSGGTPGTVTCAAVDIPTGLSTFDLTVRLAPTAPSGSLANTATITTAGTGTIAVGTSTTTATVNQCSTGSSSADLSITKAALTVAGGVFGGSVTAGGNVTAGFGAGSLGSGEIEYTLTYRNNGLSNANNVHIRDVIPAGTLLDPTFLPIGVVVTPAAGPGLTCQILPTLNEYQLDCTPNTTNSVLPTGANGTIQFAVRVPENFLDGAVIKNVAHINSEGIGATPATPDPNGGNNTSNETQNIVRASADLSVTKTGPAGVVAGSNITYTLTVTNNGVSDAQNVLVKDTLPPNVSFVSLGAGSDPRFACLPDNGNGGIVNCSAATLIAPAINAPPIIPPRVGSNIATIIIIGNVGLSVANGTVLTNNASVSASTQDPVPANNAAAPVNTTVTNDNQPTGVFQFSAASANVNETAVPGSIDLTINRTGDTTGVASVRFETSDISALQRTDYTFNSGIVRFGPGDTSKTINVLIVNDTLVEGPETFRITLSNATNGFVVGPIGSSIVTITSEDAAPGPNAIDDAGTFVRQQYLDFLGREPDAAGLNFWTGQITACGANPTCIRNQRVNVSAAFFLSIEFQETSGNVTRTQRVAFSRESADPLTRITYLQFMRDTRQVGAGVIVGQPGATALLEQNKQAYAQQIVASPEFLARFPIAPAATYVDALYASAAVVPTVAERNAAITAFGAGGTSGRVAALRSVSDSNSVRVAEFRTSFVLAEYFGYLRRNPTDAPDFNDAGYQFWLAKLNAFNGSYQDADMVKSFIESVEYRGRFGTP